MISPQIQNEVIDGIGIVVEKKIVERVTLSKFYVMRLLTEAQ